MINESVAEYLVEQARRPFVWGETDCVQLAAGMYEHLTGVRLPIPTYSSEREATRVLAELGGLEPAVTSFLGPAQRDLRRCEDGAIVLSAFQGQQTLTISLGNVLFVRRINETGLFPVGRIMGIRWWPCRSF